jgi:mono/diheme cytochrome c family protein
MNKPIWITLVSLVVLILVLPVYALQEAKRLAGAQEKTRHEYVAEGTRLYLENCADCHGSQGEGVGSMPTLDNPAFETADSQYLFQIIARAAHGSSMAAWHLEEGGTLNDFQIQQLVVLLQHGDWEQVGVTAVAMGVTTPRLPGTAGGQFLEQPVAQDDPHECISCHEDPAVHFGQFGIQCANCHTLQAWQPALLTRHEFRLDHGGEGPVPCQSCHTTSYVEYTCYECHEHPMDGMVEIHADGGIEEIADCMSCHPTGEPEDISVEEAAAFHGK